MDDRRAGEIAVSCLNFIALDEDQLHRFIALSGISPHDIRSQAMEPGFLAGVLDFVMGHEPTLIAFAAQAGIKPEDVGRARHKLSPFGEQSV